jgi:hypothetical protein
MSLAQSASDAHVDTHRYVPGSQIVPGAPQFRLEMHSTQLPSGEQYGSAAVHPVSELHSTHRCVLVEHTWSPVLLQLSVETH